jgi:hypothetical protein
MKKSKKEPSQVVEKQTGILWYDRDDGYFLQTAIPNVNFRIKDLFRGHENKKVRVTIEVLDDEA